MIRIALVVLTLTFVLKAATEPLNVKEAPPKKQPIVIPDDPKPIAEIDPETLEVTYRKGADPKQVVKQVVKAWAEALKQNQACHAELEKKKEK